MARKPRRRAGLRPDERDPAESPAAPGSAGGGVNQSGEVGGGLASGGLAGMNEDDGRPDIDRLDDAAGAGVYDDAGKEQEEGPYAGFSGGAVGGTPAGKRASGGNIGRGFSPGGEGRGDSTIGSDPHRRPS